MTRNKKFLPAILLMCVELSLSPVFARTRIISEHGYDNLIEISNDSTRVVLEPNVGGRVLSYRLNGVEIIQQDPVQAGIKPGTDPTIPRLAGGRFDVGPVVALPKHNTLWQGVYEGTITGDYSARLTSKIDPDLGIQIIREFTLSNEGSHLSCKQILINHNDTPIRCNHWSRTFAKGGGVAFAPIPEYGVFPRGYGLGGEKRGSFDFVPDPEPNVRVRENILEFLGEPNAQKSIFNLSEGWIAYVSPDDLLFIKTFPFDPSWKYADPSQHHASLWHLQDEIIEIEPNGPQQIIAPGDKTAFTENWWLAPFHMPKDKLVNLNKLRKTIKTLTGTGN